MDFFYLLYKLTYYFRLELKYNILRKYNTHKLLWQQGNLHTNQPISLTQ